MEYRKKDGRGVNYASAILTLSKGMVLCLADIGILVTRTVSLLVEGRINQA